MTSSLRKQYGGRRTTEERSDYIRSGGKVRRETRRLRLSHYTLPIWRSLQGYFLKVLTRSWWLANASEEGVLNPHLHTLMLGGERGRIPSARRFQSNLREFSFFFFFVSAFLLKSSPSDYFRVSSYLYVFTSLNFRRTLMEQHYANPVI